MTEKFKNKYRTDSLRLQGYDYGSGGIITKNEMTLSDLGEIIAIEWLKTAKIRKRVVLGEWVVMPNHFHALIYLKSRTDTSHVSQNKRKINLKDGCDPPLQKQGYKNKFGPQKYNLSSIIRGFKSACTRKIRENESENFGWQSGFYDNILRNQNALLKIEEYIRENPRKWIDDDYYVE